MNKDVDVIVFWCDEKDISENELKNMQRVFSLKNILYCGIDSSFFKQFDGNVEEKEEDKKTSKQTATMRIVEGLGKIIQ